MAPIGGLPAGGTGGFGNALPTGGFVQAGGMTPTGGTGGFNPVGGLGPTGGRTLTGGVGPSNCSFTVTSSTSQAIPTVGIVDWSTTLANVSEARVVFTLDDPGTKLNVGGVAPVEPQANNHTLLLGLKGNSSYTFECTRARMDWEGDNMWTASVNSGAPAPSCISQSWDSNHGHHLLDNGNFLLFTNGQFMSNTPSRAREFSLNPSGGSATSVHEYQSSSGSHSDSLGDVQRLPNGNTLVTFSNNGRIEELDASWNVVQVLTASSFGYSEWRETLYVEVADRARIALR